MYLKVKKNNTMIIFKSATKIVLLLIAVTFCVGFMTGKVNAEQFMIGLTAVFSFYFGQKNQVPPQV